MCGSFLHNTADKVFVLFTREAGMLYATARSVREERSKQRQSMQEFSLVRVSLIKGKQGWRVGSVEAGPNYFALTQSREARGSVVLVFKTLRRFIHGEDPHADLFDFCIWSLQRLVAEIEDRKFMELLIQLKLMIELGYVDESLVPKNFKINLSSVDVIQYKNELSAEKIEKLLKKAVENSHL